MSMNVDQVAVDGKALSCKDKTGKEHEPHVLPITMLPAAVGQKDTKYDARSVDDQRTYRWKPLTTPRWDFVS